MLLPCFIPGRELTASRLSGKCLCCWLSPGPYFSWASLHHLSPPSSDQTPLPATSLPAPSLPPHRPAALTQIAPEETVAVTAGPASQAQSRSLEGGCDFQKALVKAGLPFLSTPQFCPLRCYCTISHWANMSGPGLHPQHSLNK